MNNQVVTLGSETLTEYLRKRKPGPFKPLPLKNEEGNQIEWYWKNEDCYAEPIHVDGIWVGTLLKSFKTHEVVGVKIFLEAVK